MKKTNIIDILKQLNNIIKNNAIYVEIFGVVFACLFAYISGFLKLPSEVSNLTQTVDNHIDDYNKEKVNINNRIDQLYNISKSNGNLDVTINLDSDLLDNYIDSTSYTKDELEDRPPFSPYSVILEKDEEQFTAMDLVGQRILIPYKENGQEVFFCGQYDDTIQWTGECLINVYKNNKLIISTLAIYNNGERIEYEQIFHENGEWIYSRRITNGNNNSGDTWKYIKTKDYTQEILFENPDENKMVMPSALKDNLNEKLVSRYHGDTSNGKYNDDTGNAYLIKFSYDGTVKTLYHGRFKDGEFHDDSKRAWYITRNDKTNTSYMYYMGVFEKGKVFTDKRCIYFENPINRETFNRLLSGTNYDCAMIWAEEYIEDYKNIQ